MCDHETKISNLMNVITTVLNSYDDAKKRTRILTFGHLFYTRFLNIMVDFSYATVSSHLADNGDAFVTHSALHAACKKNSDTYVNSLISKTLELFLPYGNRRYIAVDATGIALSKVLAAENNFRLTPSGSYATAMLTGLYDVTHKMPIAVHITAHHDERKALLECLSHLKRNDCLIGDRGYFSLELVLLLMEMGIDFVFRLKGNSRMISNPIANTRIVDYQINGNDYYLITSLKTIEELQNCKHLYHERWKIEEWFKFLKGHLGGDFYCYNSCQEVQESVKWQQFVSIVFAYLSLISPDVNMKGAITHAEKIARCLAFKGKNRQKRLTSLIIILKKKLKATHRPDRHFPRTAIIFKGQWYGAIRRT